MGTGTVTVTEWGQGQEKQTAYRNEAGQKSYHKVLIVPRKANKHSQWSQC